jgi:hypothetical protein
MYSKKKSQLGLPLLPMSWQMGNPVVVQPVPLILVPHKHKIFMGSQTQLQD